jgi:hypothetical protein
MAVQLQWGTAATVQWAAGQQRNCDGQWWRQWVTAGVAMGDGNSGSTIAMGDNGGGAMDWRKAVQLWQLP